VPANYRQLTAGTRSVGIGCRLPVPDTRPKDFVNIVNVGSQAFPVAAAQFGTLYWNWSLSS